jgi:hypothetical protein
MTTFLTVVQTIGGLLTPVIALLAAYIAWQQYKTASGKLKLDLFERRYRVYRGLMDFLAAVVRDEQVTNESLGNFYRETDQKRFLFGDDICNYLKLIRENAVKLRQAHRLVVSVCEERGHVASEQKQNEVVETELDLLAWFDNQVEQAGLLFEQYLGFKKNL